MNGNTHRIGIPRAVLELFGVVFARFPPVQRIWAAWLVAANSAALLFIGHVEAQVTLGAVAVAVLAQALIYQRRRFVRILGATHIVWVPMLAWMALRLDTIPAGDAAFRAWIMLLIGTNAISLAIDAWDATRFALGDRYPYYVW
jgi:hypothetical protein